MRKTLTVLTLVTTAATLAACKMPWESEPKPAAIAPATETVDAAQPSTESATTATMATTPGPTAAPGVAAAPNSKPAAK